MNERDLEQHLSQIATQWTMLHQAHKGQADEAALARQVLMQRYCGAVFRYLLRAVRDVSVAEDLTQEFALRFIQGRFGQVDREQGRFRSYVKSALFRLVQDHYRQIGRSLKAVPLEHDVIPAGSKLRSKIPWTSVAGAALGGTAFFMMVKLTSEWYPLPTGGQPIVALPPAGVITFSS